MANSKDEPVSERGIVLAPLRKELAAFLKNIEHSADFDAEYRRPLSYMLRIAWVMKEFGYVS